MNRDKIIDKIRKILALAAGAGTQEEAFAAMLHAQRLMAEHGIDAADVVDPTAAPQGQTADCWADLLITGLDTLRQEGVRVVQTTAPRVAARPVLRNHAAKFLRGLVAGGTAALEGQR